MLRDGQRGLFDLGEALRCPGTAGGYGVTAIVGG
jgi:hypothetical protein